ncbi:unnamed protein product [Caenorhabditis angaria]|uniref:Uncharacterized protein n=1 Tax=Caenorhabditis angaria TaxID=860376 RepID=A0A9P1IBH8_9PELO|nr:unnamed protein product [Caenorhabditis angaria]
MCGFFHVNDAEPKSELIANVQKSQKTVARAAQKRRKAAEELMGDTRDSSIQTSIVQYGILQYKKKRSEIFQGFN